MAPDVHFGLGMILESPAFPMNGDIPVRYTGEGADLSPPLSWSGVPSASVSLAIICEDPDAPKRPGLDHPFTHWVIYGIPVTVSELPEGLPKERMIDQPVQALQGVNSFGMIGYGGPRPPIGAGPHRYIFTLYALMREIDLPPGAEKKDLLNAMKDKILATAELTGLYERRGGGGG